MKNKAKRASALVLLLLPMFCEYATTVESPGPFTTRNVRSLQNGRHVAAKKEATLNGGLNGVLPFNEKRRSLASLAVAGNPNNGQANECRLSPAILSQIRKPSADEWLIDDSTVMLLKSNLQELIWCTKPFDKVLFGAQKVIRVSRTIAITHPLVFVRAATRKFSSKVGDSSSTVFTCPAYGPVFLVNTFYFRALNFTIRGCKQSYTLGSIVVLPRSMVTLEHFSIQDNKIRGIYVSVQASSRIHEGYFARNEIYGNGAAIRTEKDNFITITNSIFKENTASDGAGGALYSDSYNSVVINGSIFTGNNATYYGGCVYLYSRNTLTVFGSELSNNNATWGGAISGSSLNTIRIVTTHFSDNTASSGGALDIGTDNTLTLINSAMSINAAKLFGGAIRLSSYNKATIRGCLLSNNNAKYGGATSTYGNNTLTTIDCVFSTNNAEVFGGAFDLGDYEFLVIQGCALSNNKAKYGGAVSLDSYDNSIIQESTLSDNEARFGGALYAYKQNKAAILDSSLARNSGYYSTKYGEGVYLHGDSNVLIIKNTSISRNNALGSEYSYSHSAKDAAIDAARAARIEDEAKYAESVAY